MVAVQDYAVKYLAALILSSMFVTFYFNRKEVQNILEKEKFK